MKKLLTLLFVLFTSCSVNAATPTENHHYVNGEIPIATTLNADFTRMDACISSTNYEWNVGTVYSKTILRAVTINYSMISPTPDDVVFRIPVGYNKIISVSINNQSGVETINILSRLLSAKTQPTTVTSSVSSSSKPQFNTSLLDTYEYFVESSCDTSWTSLVLTLTRDDILHNHAFKICTINMPLTATVVFTKDTVAGLTLWFDAEQGVSLSGSEVLTWADQSATGETLTGGASGARPTLYTGVQNSRSALYFDGGNDVLSHLSVASSQAQPATIFMVYKPTNWSTGINQNILFNDAYITGKKYGTTQIAEYAGSEGLISGGANNTCALFTSVVNGVSSTMALNGNSDTSVSLGSSNIWKALTVAQSLTVGLPSASFPYAGYIMEIMVYNGALSAANQTIVKEYLNSKWAIY